MFYINRILSQDKYEVYKFDLSWFRDEANHGVLSEREWDYINPIIRKNKIKKLLTR